MTAQSPFRVQVKTGSERYVDIDNGAPSHGFLTKGRTVVGNSSCSKVCGENEYIFMIIGFF